MKNIILEGIKEEKKFHPIEIGAKEIDRALEFVLKRIDESMNDFTYKFPASSSINGIYPGVDNNEWTCSFYTGMLWLAYEITGDEKYRKVAEIHTDSFEERLQTGDVDTHDLGFLYSLSCVAQYKLTGNERAKKIAVNAAEHLMRRWKEKGNFIQAWGDINDKNNYRFIIDCLMNLPLIYWAAEETNNKLYTERAHKHLMTTIENIVRPDASTFHTFFMNPDNGLPHHGETHQGYSDTSCWSRGQAWGMYGLPLSFGYVKEPLALEVCEKLTDYYLNRLPDDFVPYWDLIFTEGEETRDSSAAAIAVCGLDEFIPHVTNEKKKNIYKNAADNTLKSLIDNYTTFGTKSNGVLAHGVYAKPANRGVDECVIWGDYYYMEALVRYRGNWKKYW